MSDDPTEKMVRDYQDRIVGGTYDGLYSLDEASLDHVMECQAARCAVAFADLYRIPAELDLDAFLERMRSGGSSKIRITRQNDSILWEELHEGQCVCPLVTREVIPLEPGLCRCAIHWLRKLFERHVRGPVRVDLVDSAALGGRSCTFRVHIDDRTHP